MADDINENNDNIIYATAIVDQPKEIEPSAPPFLVVEAEPQPESLQDLIKVLEQHLNLSKGESTVDRVNIACNELGISVEGSLLDRARKCCRIIEGNNDENSEALRSVNAAKLANHNNPLVQLCINTGRMLTTTDWNWGKDAPGDESYEKNPLAFRSDHSFSTLKDSCHGEWCLKADSTGQHEIILRMDWKGKQFGNWAEFGIQESNNDTIFRGVGSSYNFMRSWNIVKRSSCNGSVENRRAVATSHNDSLVQSVIDVQRMLVNTDWSAGKDESGSQSYRNNPWIFRSDYTFATLKDGCHGEWSISARSTGQMILRMDWKGKQFGNWAEFAIQESNNDTIFRGVGSSYNFMRSWNIVKRGPTRPNGEWTAPYPKISTEDIAGCWGCVCFPCVWAVERKISYGEDKVMHSGIAFLLCLIPCPFNFMWTRLPNTNTFQRDNGPQILNYQTSCCATVPAPVVNCKICPC